MLVHFRNCWQGGLGLSLSIKNYQFNHSYHYHILAGGGRGDLWCPCQLPIANYESSMINIAMKTSSSWQVVAGGTEGQLAATRWHWSAWIVILGERSDNDTWYWYRSIIINTMTNSERRDASDTRSDPTGAVRAGASSQLHCNGHRHTTRDVGGWSLLAPVVIEGMGKKLVRAHHPWCRWVVLSSLLSTSCHCGLMQWFLS